MKISKKTFFLFLYSFLIFFLAILPINNKNDLINHTFIQSFRLDHIFHALLFFPWMILPALFSAKKPFGNFKHSKVTWFLGGLLLGIFTEGIQCFIQYRSFTLIDFLSNISGLLIGWFCLPVLMLNRNLKK